MPAEKLPTLLEIRHDILNVVTGGDPQSATEQQRSTASALTDIMLGHARRYHRWYGRVIASLHDERDAWKRFANELIEHHTNGDLAKAALWRLYQDITDINWQDGDADRDREPSTSTDLIRPGRWKAVVRAHGRRKTKLFSSEEAADTWTDQMILAIRRGDWET